MKISWARDSMQQVSALHAYIAEDSVEAADRTVLKIRDAIRLLSVHPLVGREGRVKNTRELVITGTPYIVVYRVRRPDTIEILAVIHARQRWPSTF